MGEIAVLDRQIPLKAIPESTLNEIIVDQFTVWVASLLSLTDEVSADRLEMALPAVKEHCWSMGFSEIKKMFEMYADNKLSIKPIPNYFDRILFGKIVESYKQQKPVNKNKTEIPEVSKEEQENLIYTGIVNCFDGWVQNKCIINGYAWVHDHLMDLKLLSFTKEEKAIMWKQAKENLIEQSKGMGYSKAKDLLRELERKNSSKREVEYKLIRLTRFFEKIHAKDEHIKDKI